jgi:hypothetical protein
VRVALIGCVALATAALAAPAAARTRTVGCGESIDVTAFPYLGGAEPRYRYRIVLGTIAVPPTFQEQIVPTTNWPWKYFRKAGIVMRAGATPVVVSVPRAWQSRVALAWGYASAGVFTSLRFAAAPEKETRVSLTQAVSPSKGKPSACRSPFALAHERRRCGSDSAGAVEPA